MHSRLERRPQETCVKFHELVLTMLLGYRKSLRVLSKVMMKKNKKRDIIELCAKLFWCFTNLLWWIVHSQMLHYHLAVLEVANVLQFPVYTHQHLYFI